MTLLNNRGSAMVGRARDPESVLGSSARPLELTGLWSPQEEDAWRIKSALPRGITLTLILGMSVVSVLKLVMERPREIEELGTCIFTIAILWAVFFKVVCFYAQGPTLRQLVKLLLEIRAVYSTDEHNDEIRRRYRRLEDRMYLILLGMIIPAEATWAAMPLIHQLLNREEEEVSQLLPLPIWLPLDIYASPTYEVIYAAQVLTIPFCTLSLCCDFVFIDLMLRIAAELKILNGNLLGLHKDQISVSMKSKNEYKPVDRDSDDEINLQLSKNVKHHQAILRSINLLEQAVRTGIFILFLAMTIGISISIFGTMSLLQTAGGRTRALKFICAMPIVLFEAGSYCVFGQVVTDQSEKLMHSAYSCGWVDCDTRFRRNLLTFCMGARRPLEITVGRMSKLSKETFLQPAAVITRTSKRKSRYTSVTIAYASFSLRFPKVEWKNISTNRCISVANAPGIFFIISFLPLDWNNICRNRCAGVAIPQGIVFIISFPLISAATSIFGAQFLPYINGEGKNRCCI